MPVSQYMELCLTHPRYGYYTNLDPFGTGGDFTTSPEISQMFGELIGLWSASVWTAMGEPASINCRTRTRPWHHDGRYHAHDENLPAFHDAITSISSK